VKPQYRSPPWPDGSDLQGGQQGTLQGAQQDVLLGADPIDPLVSYFLDVGEAHSCLDFSLFHSDQTHESRSPVDSHRRGENYLEYSLPPPTTAFPNTQRHSQIRSHSFNSASPDTEPQFASNKVNHFPSRSTGFVLTCSSCRKTFDKPYLLKYINPSNASSGKANMSSAATPKRIYGHSSVYSMTAPIICEASHTRRTSLGICGHCIQH
jgi:hypothetical protein